MSDYTPLPRHQRPDESAAAFHERPKRTNYITIELKKIFDSCKAAAWLVNELPYPDVDVTSQLMKKW